MAFTYCTNCGEKIDINAPRCPHCGCVLHQEHSYTHEQYREQENTGFNPNQGGFNPNQGGFNPLYRTPMHPVKRPISTGLLVFSIINIVFSCCVLPSLIFGIIALVFTIQAQSARNTEDEITKKKIALILNIVGVILAAATIVSSFIIIADTLPEILNNIQK